MTNGVVLECPRGHVPESKTHKEMTQEGHDFEEQFFGFSPTGHLRVDRTKAPSILFRDCLAEVMKRQTELMWDPRNPNTPLANALFRSVKDKLSLRSRSQLRLYCALGTPLDFKFFADGFFALEEEIDSVVTFDLARADSWHKRNNLKAHMLITIRDMSSPKAIMHTSAVVIRHLNERRLKPSYRTSTRPTGRRFR